MTTSERDAAAIEKFNEHLGYDKTGEDWVLEIHTILTEPVCPSAVIKSESNPDEKWVAVWGDTITEAIETAVDEAIKKFASTKKDDQ